LNRRANPTRPEEKKVELACLDLEGVLIPEIWINFAERTGIDELRATTRDIPDYDVLMKQRLGILEQHKLGLADIQDVISGLSPLPGAKDCLDWLRNHFQVVILSDTFYEFAEPLMRQLGFPTLFCHKLEMNDAGMIVDYHLRQADPKRKAVQAFHGLNFRIIATGDSYNDTTMLGEADAGILFCPPQNVIDEFPQFPVAKSYAELQAEFAKASERDIPAP
jgi:phosphoserine/homoserine phosphotransferase